MQNNYRNFKEKLDRTLVFPAIYMFKFLAPIDKINDVLDLFHGQESETRVSSGGNYIGVTFTPLMYNSDKIIEKYEEAAQIKGVVAL